MSVSHSLIKSSRPVGTVEAAPAPTAPRGNWMEPTDLQSAWRLAESLAHSPFMPDALVVRGNLQATTNNMLAVMQVAQSMGVPAIVLLQNTHIIHGKLGFASTLLLAQANKSGLFRGPIEFDVQGRESPNWPKSLSVRAWAIRADTGERVTGPEVTWAMAEAEGWATKTGSKWKTMPELMGTYRAGTLFIRTRCPEVLHGVAPRTADELEDMEPEHVETVRSVPVSAVDRARALGAASVVAEVVDADAPPPDEKTARAELATRLRDAVAQGADESYVRAACLESALCSEAWVNNLVAKLFPKGEVVA